MTTRRYGTEDDGNYFFQSASAQSKSARRAEKANSYAGNPIKLNAKLSAVIRDESEEGAVFVADNGGGVRRIDLKVRGLETGMGRLQADDEWDRQTRRRIHIKAHDIQLRRSR